jgi:hypothetical protein
MSKALIKSDIKNKVFTIRGVNVMLDRDLAALYGVEVRALNQAVKRNIERFPEDFMFQLNDDEFKIWKSQIVITKSINMGLRRSPYAFTENGVAMLSSVLKSKRAIAINMQIMRVFTTMRRYVLDNHAADRIDKRLEYVETALLLYMEKNDKRVDDIILALNALMEEPEKEPKRIGFVRDREPEK